ncbi:MAG TPA: ATP cone domain-containing protein, partial [Chromatiaceae bacterium]|nr:ATP cone domain-containing protein [Chromatiaceae bacterium]
MPIPLPRPATLPTRIRKRDGQDVAFDAAKIRSAIERAGRASGEFSAPEAQRLTAQVIKVLSHRDDQGRPPEVEAIQDLVEQTLIAADHFATARAYIRYREQHRKLRTDRRTLVDAAASIDEYLDRSDWRVATEAGYKYILFRQPQGTESKDVEEYIASVDPEPGAILLLDDPGINESIERGRRLFEDPNVGCVECHPAPLYTDLGMHDVGTRSQ